MELKLLSNKLGLSNIVATLLLVFLTVVAITIVATFVVPLVRDGLEGTECYQYQTYYSFEEEFGYACHAGDLYAVSVRNTGSASEGLSLPQGFVLVYGNEDERQAHEIVDGVPIGEVRMLDETEPSFITPGIGEVRTYVYDSAGTLNVEYVEVYALLEDGERCDLSDSISVEAVCTGERVL